MVDGNGLVSRRSNPASVRIRPSALGWHFTLKYGLANHRRKEMQLLNFMAECPLNGVRHCNEVGLKYPLSYETR